MLVLDADPDETVQFDNQPISLRTMISRYVQMKATNVPLFPILVYRDPGKKPEILGDVELDELAEQDAYK